MFNENSLIEKKKPNNDEKDSLESSESEQSQNQESPTIKV